MLVAAAVCPHPPLLVPEMAGDAAPELDDLRTACDAAIRRLPEGPLVVVGGADATREYGVDVSGSLQPYGVDQTIGESEPVLPLSLTIGRRLLQDVIGAAPVRVRYQGIAEQATPRECLRLGRELAGAAERVAMLVMGDGSACRADKASDDLDERAEPYDAAVARALAGADAAALAALDPGLSQELQVAGRAAWQVLAGAAGDSGFSGSLLADVAPYGVGYFVASWVRDFS